MTLTLHRPVHRTHRAPLASLQGEVHRFTGVIDRLGSFQCGEETEHTLCLRELQLADTRQPLDPDHWWFRLREVWAEAGVRVGDTVLFTAKVQRCTKGWADPARPAQPARRHRQQVMGFGAAPRSVVVLSRRQTTSRSLEDLQAQNQQLEARLEQSLEDQERLAQHRDALLRDSEQLGERLHQTSSNLEQEHRLSDALRHSLRRLRRQALAAALMALTLGGVTGLALGSRQAASVDSASVELVR